MKKVLIGLGIVVVVLGIVLWRVYANLDKIVASLKASPDIEALRSAFALLSEEMGVVVHSFGLGDVADIYQIHCPMAFKNRGATWFQASDGSWKKK